MGLSPGLGPKGAGFPAMGDSWSTAWPDYHKLYLVLCRVLFSKHRTGIEQRTLSL